ncbi:MAG: hypothetical protein ACJ8CR_09140 [Roseiflexaceae bacterium]
MLQAGDAVILEERPNPGLTVRDLNACYYHDFSAALAQQFLAADGLMAWWKDRLRDKARALQSDSATESETTA